ncbi:unnamed protein product [Sphenostylis stenocarpa]|uniref:Uncharacterized protein n=1 Tax=Sphenostylis stenocarpa TaxID=92480 RepID=A0AA86W5T6_9FABA|nr:unnamed protein product [Sphenostylis stenocarpa]
MPAAPAGGALNGQPHLFGADPEVAAGEGDLERLLRQLEAGQYMTGGRCRRDCDVVGNLSLAFTRSVRLVGDGRDAWVFDIDETLLSNAEIFNETSFNNLVNFAAAPALLANLILFNELKELGFRIFLITGRSEYQRNAIEANLLLGYRNWEI